MPPERNISELMRLYARVQGVVQGVNFRWYTQRRASDLGLAGFVRNLPDGSVEVVAEGTRGSLESLLDFLHVGPSSASVDEVETRWSSPTREFNRFEVRY